MSDIYFKNLSYEKGILHLLREEEFPLTLRMVRENNYRDTDLIRALYRRDREDPSAIAIYRESYDDESAITKRRIFVFEVSLEEHGRGLGHELMEDLKWDCEEITLSSLVDSFFFYVKEGFEVSGENELKWKRPIR